MLKNLGGVTRIFSTIPDKFEVEFDSIFRVSVCTGALVHLEIPKAHQLN